jgi:3-phosphoshikimate 1-carboxyvinyltransferase
MIRSYPDHGPIERDWSAAAFWYEYVALHGGEVFLQDLRPSSLQGDQCVADIFSRLGVQTRYLTDPQRGVLLTKDPSFVLPETLAVDFSDCPDLYPAVAITCEQSDIRLNAQGTERLPLKESNRLKAVKEHITYHDHRVAMALLAADLPCNDTDCISKSYPDFLSQLRQVQDSQKTSH